MAGLEPSSNSGLGQLPKALSASSLAAILAPGTAAGSLRAPEEGSPNPAGSFLLPPRIQTPRQLLGSRTENGMLPSVPTAPSFFPEGPGGCSKFAPAGERSRAPRPKRGAAGGGEGRARERGVGDPEGEEQECAASALPFSKQRCHTRRALRFLGLWRESRARGRAGGRGDHTGEPPPAPAPPPPPSPWRAPRVSLPAPRALHGGCPESHTLDRRARGLPPASPSPGLEELLHFPKPTGAPAPAPALRPQPIHCAPPQPGRGGGKESAAAAKGDSRSRAGGRRGRGHLLLEARCWALQTRNKGPDPRRLEPRECSSVSAPARAAAAAAAAGHGHGAGDGDRARARGRGPGRPRVRRALALRSGSGSGSGSGPGSARLRSWLPSGSWHQLRAVT
ncbi:uncharacterized protein LOC144289925 [Canis aureus]